MMIECITCHTVIDVDDDVAYDLGWSFITYYHDTEKEITEWDCPHCIIAEVN